METSNKTLKSGVITVLVTGLLAGTMDGLAACITYYIRTGNHPGPVFKYISSGILGQDAFAGGSSIIVLGVLLHYKIAFTWTILFFFLYPKLNRIIQNKYYLGVIMGIFVWIIMNLVVLPLSNVPQITFNLQGVIVGASILVVCIGLPISLMLSRHYGDANDN